ncbi:hypothetical protein CK203_102213 [Vitis vinifera]|uniref:Uncharacterized protein n=1 Tax=Vitis vinifera TaxID=29760 RepID=A0A438DFL8_VITVI|nr:hypothetical protein CK203_102213 [Vitis vinifera]
MQSSIVGMDSCNSFGNMTLELNIFYMCKKPINLEEEEGPEEGYLNPQICLLLYHLGGG